MKTPNTIDLLVLPKAAQKQVYDFYLAAKKQGNRQANIISECALLSENALAKAWLNQTEDEAWREFQ